MCGSPLEIEHALSCHFGGLPIRRHNEVRNLLVSCIRKSGCETAIETPLQRLSGEQFTRPSTTTDNEACLDIIAVSGGMGARKHFSTSGCSTRSLPRTVPSPCQRCIGVTSVKSGLALKSGCVKSREPHSPRLCSRWQEEPSKFTTTFLKAAFPTSRRGRQKWRSEAHFFIFFFEGLGCCLNPKESPN